MKITNIQIKNFRLLKDFSIDIEDHLSLVIGKNNTGKTSFLTVLERFLNPSDKNNFHYFDFNVDLKSKLEQLVDSAQIDEIAYSEIGISLRIIIKYSPSCDLENISHVMTDLDPDNSYIALGWDYTLDYTKYCLLHSDYKIFKNKEEKKCKKYTKEDKEYIQKTFTDFISKRCGEYFKVRVKSLTIDKDTQVIDEVNYISLDKEKYILRDIINFKYISAKRAVNNADNDKTLSAQTSRIYEKKEVDEEQFDAIEEFKDSLSDTDSKLTSIYNNKLFKDTIEKVRKFGGITVGETIIEIISSLQHRELLSGNTTVAYRHNEDNMLPENYNGLGYMNLICMIFDIELKLSDFKRKKDEKPADINLLFIEEPEAHTHPQMQYVFIQNIKDAIGTTIKQGGAEKSLQCIISTHSSHIVADSDFADIKYLRKRNVNSVIAKNLKDLKTEYESNGEEASYRFLKQYLTLNRSELFFAEKAIFVEGETESILIPSMMKKLDNEQPDNPLLSQNISIIPVGAHSKVFDRFIRFIGLKKGLIITDIDSYYTIETTKDGKPKSEYTPCPAHDPNVKFSGNSSLWYFHNNIKDIAYYNTLSLDWKVLRWKNDRWVSNRKSNLLVCYQTCENGYIARSFEDAFFNINEAYLKSLNNEFPAITPKWLKKYRDGEIGAFELAKYGIGSKPSFAIEILMNDKDNLSWNIPDYIKEGLLWLKKD